MLKDITIGQYFPGKSVLHRLDPRMKILLTVGYIVMLFTVSNPLGLCVGILFLIFAYAISGIPPRMITKSLKPVIPIIIFTTVLNMFFVKGDPLFDWWIFHISRQGLLTAVVMTIRIICLIAGTSLLTYTTSPITLTDGLERLMKPLKKVHFPVHELSMMMTISSIFSVIANTPESLGMRTELWEYLRKKDPALYRRCRYRLTNVGTNIPGYQGRKLSVTLYRLARKIYKFN